MRTMQSWNSNCRGYMKSCDEGMKVMLVTNHYEILGSMYHCHAVVVHGRVFVDETRWDIRAQTRTFAGLKVYMTMMAVATKGQMIVNRLPAHLRAKRSISSPGTHLRRKMAWFLLRYRPSPQCPNRRPHLRNQIHQNPCLPECRGTRGQRARTASVMTASTQTKGC